MLSHKIKTEAEELLPRIYLGTIDAVYEAFAPLLTAESEPEVFSECAQFGEYRRKTLLAGRGLLKYALRHNGVIEPDESLPHLEYGRLGKPVITGCGSWQFNLSHSLNFMVLILGLGEQSVDLEVSLKKRRKVRDNLVDKVLTPDEFAQYQKVLATKGDAPAGHYFKRQWTIRECLVKLAGASIFSLEQQRIDIKVRKAGFTAAAALTLPPGNIISTVIPKDALLVTGGTDSLELAAYGTDNSLLLSFYCPPSLEKRTVISAATAAPDVPVAAADRAAADRTIADRAAANRAANFSLQVLRTGTSSFETCFLGNIECYQLESWP